MTRFVDLHSKLLVENFADMTVVVRLNLLTLVFISENRGAA
jgi:hypothetical protein